MKSESKNYRNQRRGGGTVLFSALLTQPLSLGGFRSTPGELLALGLLFWGILLYTQRRYLSGSLLIGLAISWRVAEGVCLR